MALMYRERAIRERPSGGKVPTLTYSEVREVVQYFVVFIVRHGVSHVFVHGTVRPVLLSVRSPSSVVPKRIRRPMIIDTVLRRCRKLSGFSESSFRLLRISERLDFSSEA